MGYYKRSFPASATKRKGNPNWNPSYKKSTVVPGSKYIPVSNPSAEQEAIFDKIVNGVGSLLVSAYAGCGKTTVCVEAMWRVQRKSPRTTQKYIIFAKRNQEEAIGKCPPSVDPKTAHAFGLAALSRAFGKIQIDKEKTDRIATALVGADDDKAELRYMTAKAIDLGKDYLATTHEEIAHIIEKHSIELCNLTEAEFVANVLKGMDISALQPNIVSFSDMTWLPIRLNIAIPTYDIVYADEVQDLNPARLELLFRALGTNGRLAAVGDDNQAIFAFSGADQYAMAKIVERTGAIILPLHRTYRCGKKIVELARMYVPDYEAAETNCAGNVSTITMQDMMSDTGAREGDFILSRTNAPTVKIAMQLLKRGRKCNIQGRDLGRNLLYMIIRSKAESVAGFQTWLEEWKAAEIDRLSAKKRDYEHIVDKAECLESFCEGERDLSAVKSKIAAMFDDSEPDETHRIILSTVHRAKGLERNRVFRLESSFTVKPKTEEDIQQERNVAYVSITRAKDSLFLVE